MTDAVHVVGGGLAGLSAAVRLTQAGAHVILHEAGPQAGGRCRSYDDRALGLRVDNGNHVLLSGNADAMAYLRIIGAEHTVRIPAHAVFPYVDVRTGERWTLRPNAGRIPWWIAVPSRRVPGTRARDYLGLLRLLYPRRGTTVADTLPNGALRKKFVEPFAVSALNTPAREGDARLLASVLRQSMARGGAALRSVLPRAGWSETLVYPALAWLRARGAEIRLNDRVVAIDKGIVRTTAGEERAAAIVLAVPAPNATAMLPGLAAPDEFQTIINVHFATNAVTSVDLAGTASLGVIGGALEWLVLKPGHISTTTSAANALADVDSDAFAQQVWLDVCWALDIAAPIPPHRVVREKRATFAATLGNSALRPRSGSCFAGVVLAGDWTDTGLPATIEGAIRSGRIAAEVIRAARQGALPTDLRQGPDAVRNTRST